MHNRKISVTGLGYVGLPLAVAFGMQRQVIGFDNDHKRIAELVNHEDNSKVVSHEQLKKSDIRFTGNAEDIRSADFHIIAVPTPVNQARQPDLGPLMSASTTVGNALKQGDIVVYESTVYPGATEEDCLPILESCSGLKAGRDFFLGYSPERINPGDREHTLENTVKIVSAQDQTTLQIIAEVYTSVVKAGLHCAASIRVAEAAKVIENTQRDLNIALMNELVLIFNKLGIDTHEVLEAAGTKWNFLKFRPGLVGGHCIGVDPYYLTHKAVAVGYIPQVILSGRSINDGMGTYVANRVVKQLIHNGCSVRGAVVTILGLTFKENVPDLRNTRVIDIINELKSFGVKVQVNDVAADSDDARTEYGLTLTGLNELVKADGVILAVAHAEYLEQGWPLIMRLLKNQQGIVFDVKAVLPRESVPAGIKHERL